MEGVWYSKLYQGPVSWRPTTSSDDSLHSPTVIPPSALDKPSIMKRHHRRRTRSHTSPRRSPTVVTLHDTVCRVPMVEWRLDCEDCRHLTVVDLHDTGPRSDINSCCGFNDRKGYLFQSAKTRYRSSSGEQWLRVEVHTSDINTTPK